MCGISGFLDLSCASSADDLRSIALRMAATLHHRGPNDGGVWVDADAGVALSMRRLAILDLSPAGHQPMVSASVPPRIGPAIGARMVVIIHKPIANSTRCGGVTRMIKVCEAGISGPPHSP